MGGRGSGSNEGKISRGSIDLSRLTRRLRHKPTLASLSVGPRGSFHLVCPIMPEALEPSSPNHARGAATLAMPVIPDRRDKVFREKNRQFGGDDPAS